MLKLSGRIYREIKAIRLISNIFQSILQQKQFLPSESGPVYQFINWHYKSW